MQPQSMELGQEVSRAQTKAGDVSKWCVGKGVGTPRIRLSCYWQEKGKEIESWLGTLIQLEKTEVQKVRVRAPWMRHTVRPK